MSHADPKPPPLVPAHPDPDRRRIGDAGLRPGHDLDTDGCARRDRLQDHPVQGERADRRNDRRACQGVDAIRDEGLGRRDGDRWTLSDDVLGKLLSRPGRGIGSVPSPGRASDRSTASVCLWRDQRCSSRRPFTRYAACATSLRTRAAGSSTAKVQIDRNTKVLVATRVKGGAWSKTCAGRSVSGSAWYRISMIGGRTVRALYGVSYLYAPGGSFKTTVSAAPTTPLPPPAPTTPGTTINVSSIPALLTALADNSVDTIVVADGTYHISRSGDQQVRFARGSAHGSQRGHARSPFGQPPGVASRSTEGA